MEADEYHVQFWTPDAGEASANWGKSCKHHEVDHEWLVGGGLSSLEKRQPWGT